GSSAEQQLVRVVRAGVEAHLDEHQRAARARLRERHLLDHGGVGDLARLRPVPALAGDVVAERLLVDAAQLDVSHRRSSGRTRRTRADPASEDREASRSPGTAPARTSLRGPYPRTWTGRAPPPAPSVPCCARRG